MNGVPEFFLSASWYLLAIAVIEQRPKLTTPRFLSACEIVCLAKIGGNIRIEIVNQRGLFVEIVVNVP